MIPTPPRARGRDLFARSALATILILPMWPSTRAIAGILTGHLELGGTRPAQPRYPSARGTPRVEEAVVWLERIPGPVEHRLVAGPWRWFWERRPEPLRPRVLEYGVRFFPRVLAVAAGSVVTIRNLDSVWHGTFSVSPAHPFEVGKRPPGSVDTLVFARTGLVPLRCDIHPDMVGYVVVTPNHALTRPDPTGSWRLPELPAGGYVVHAWHPERGELHRSVTVPERGPTGVDLRW